MKLKKVSIPVHRVQQNFLDSRAWIRGFYGGRGAGKSVVGGLDITRRARGGDSFLCVAPDYSQMLDASFPIFLDLTKRLGLYINHWKSSPYRVEFKSQLNGGTSQLVFRSADRPESLAGGSFRGAWMDEASLVNRRAFDVVLPALRHRGKMGWITMTFTPKGKKHWTYEQFFQKDGTPQDRCEIFHCPSRNNPFLAEEFTEAIASRFTIAAQAQELEGEFIDLAGNMMRYESFRKVDAVPAVADRIRYWDKAATIDGGAYSAGVLMARTSQGGVFVEDVVRGQWSYLERNRVMEDTAIQDAENYGNTVRIYFEQEPGSGGKESAQQTIRQLARFPVYRDIVSGGKSHRTKDQEKLPGQAKITRAQPFAAQVEAGNVSILRGGWNADYLEELCAFPEFTFMDQVDASSGAYNQLVKHAAEYSGPAEHHEPPPIDTARHGVRINRTPRIRRR